MKTTQVIRPMFKTWSDVWYLALRPAMLRRQSPVGIVRNGSVKQVIECCVCGERESRCAKYPPTRRFQTFRYGHAEECAQREVVRRLDGSLAALAEAPEVWA